MIRKSAGQRENRHEVAQSELGDLELISVKRAAALVKHEVFHPGVCELLARLAE
jgi:hypothetical protein